MLFKIDDSPTPGIARVEIVKSKGLNLMGDELYVVKVLEVIKLSRFRSCKVGQRLTVSGKLLMKEAHEKK